MTETEYRKHPAISHSQLLRIAESPEKFRYYQDNPKLPTASKLSGQYLHAITLQPETVNDNFAIIPDVDKRTKEGKEIMKQFAIEAAGKGVVTVEMADKAEAMKAALMQNEYVAKLLNGEREKPYFWTDKMTGEQCKCRVDCLSEVGENLVVVDIKTTTNAETEAFTRSALKYGYDVQAAMYLEGVEANTGRKPIFVLIAIEKEPPYCINILQVDKIFLQYGYDRFRELIGIYADCKKRNDWWGYLGRYSQINNLALPAYLAKAIE